MAYAYIMPKGCTRAPTRVHANITDTRTHTHMHAHAHAHTHTQVLRNDIHVPIVLHRDLILERIDGLRDTIGREPNTFWEYR